MQAHISNQLTITDPPTRILYHLEDHFTIKNPKFIEAKKFGRLTKGISQNLEFCKSTFEGLSLPRGATKEIMDIIGDCEIIDHRNSLSDLELSFYGKLRPYQQQAVTDSLHKDFGVLEAGTGSGKTVIALSIIAARKQPTLILVHTKELLYQWQDRVTTFLNIDAGLIGAGNFDIQPVTIGIVNTVKKHLTEQLCLLKTL